MLGRVRVRSLRDETCRFRFIAIQQPFGRIAAEAFGIDPNRPDSFAVILNGRACYSRRVGSRLPRR